MLTAEELIRSRRMRLTPQRRAVLALFLDQPGKHWSADHIRDQLLPSMPELARGTTYKTLNEFVRQGILEELATVDGSLLYGLRLEPHHHFFCESCRNWYDVTARGLEQLRLDGLTNHLVESVDITFRGVCAHCQADQKAPHQTPPAHTP